MIPGSVAPLLLGTTAGALQIGQAFEGGYYAGTITYGAEAWLGIGGEQYHLVVAPKASGDSSTYRQYKTTATCDGAESTQTSPSSIWDGYHNTYTSVIGSSSAHPAANYCQPLTINGYSDWYLGAREELKLAFTNLLTLAAWQTGGSEVFRLTTNAGAAGVYYWTSTGSSCETGSGASAILIGSSGATLASPVLVYGWLRTESFGVRAIRRVTA